MIRVISLRQELIEFIQTNEDLQKFIREQPIWYRKLTREPMDIDKFELAMMQYYKKTIPDRVDKFQNQIQMASFLVEMFKSMRS